MTLAQLQRGTQVLVPVRYLPPPPPPGASTVPGIVMDAQCVGVAGSGALAQVALSVQVPGQRQTQRVTLSAPGGMQAEFDLLPYAPAPADAGLWGGYR